VNKPLAAKPGAFARSASPAAAQCPGGFADAGLFQFPQLRWAFNHARELGPTKEVACGDGSVVSLESAPRDLGALAFFTGDGERLTLSESLKRTHADGFIVLHKGRIVHETYAGEGAAHRPHICMSVTKSVVGTIAATLIHEGALDPHALAPYYVPELSQGAYRDASLRQILDMLIGVAYREDYANPDAEIWDYARAGGLFPRPESYDGPEGFRAYLTGLRKQGEHGWTFDYKSVNTEVLGWILQRVTAQSLADLVSARIWSRIGAETDAFFLVDGTGSEAAGCGFAASLRDLARFGEMMRNEGAANGRQVVPAAVVADIRRGGDRTHFKAAGYSTLPGFSYRNMWWATHDAHGAFLARGIHGQSLYVDPVAEIVIARFASFPLAANRHNDPLTFPAYRAIIETLSA
jgi:CubicO group peptidase (beta-lactamase class C family)